MMGSSNTSFKNFFGRGLLIGEGLLIREGLLLRGGGGGLLSDGTEKGFPREGPGSRKILNLFKDSGNFLILFWNFRLTWSDQIGIQA